MAKANEESLKDAIKAATSKVLRFRDRGLGEQNTKASLIEPILEALGWDIRDPDEVHREFKPTSRDSPVDYALKLIRKPRLFVEAKGLGEELSDRKWIAQVLGYATVAGVEWCVLSDGDEFRFYNAIVPLDAEEKLFCKLRLSDSTEAEAVKTLRLISRQNMEENLIDVLWSAHFVDRQVRESLKRLVETTDKRLIRLVRADCPKLAPKDIADSIRRLDIRINSPADLPESTGIARRQPAPPTTSKTSSKKLTKTPPKAIRQTKRKPTTMYIGITLGDVCKAGILKPPVKLFREYRGTKLEATLKPDGAVEFKGVTYTTASNAAANARATIAGRPMSTNGWEFWQYLDGDRKAKTLEDARAEYLKKVGKSEGK